MTPRPAPRRKRSNAASWVIAVIVLAVLAAAAVLLVRRAQQPAPAAGSVPAMPADAAGPASAATAPAIEHPIDQAAAAPAAASTAALPALADSDAAVVEGLTALAGGQDIGAWLVRQSLIPRIVATVDALPRADVGRFILPVKPATGSLQLAAGEAGQTIAPANAERYAPYMRALAAVDPQALVDWYVRYYPLFQQAYVELGYPRGYFNDRLVAVIDHLLAAPEPATPPAVVPYKAGYAYADPALQALSVGQKTLVRIGPANEAAVKAKLRAIRDRLAGHGPTRAMAKPAAAGSATAP